MRITLTQDEIVDVLKKHINESTDYKFGDVPEDSGYFYIEAATKEVNDVENVEFVVDFV